MSHLTGDEEDYKIQVIVKAESIITVFMILQWPQKD